MATTKAQRGEKMIQVTLYLWTNDIAKGKDKIRPGHAWGAGAVYVEPNPSHGILKRKKGQMFHSMSEISVAVEKALKITGVKLHLSTPQQRLYSKK